MTLPQIDIAGKTRGVIENLALGIETLAVIVILVAIIHGTARYLLQNRRLPRGAAYASYKLQLGKALLIGLELLVAADVVRTVALNATLANVAILGFLVLIRTFLSWSLTVEIEGRWPWQGKEQTNPEQSSLS